MSKDECTCDAQWSGKDEALYCALGCPSCTCKTDNPIYQIVKVVSYSDTKIRLHKTLVQDMMDEHMVKTSSSKRL